MDSKLDSVLAMNPTTSSPRLARPTAVTTPLPANFETWPKPMKERFRRHALSVISDH